MSIHYKFKNALNVDTVTFDGLHISVGDLKKSIIQQKQLGNSADFDLKITNAQTKEEYIDEAHLIPKNTSLIIARIPLAHASKKIFDQNAFQQNQTKSLPRVDKVILDISKMNGSEEEKIQAMMLQSSADYDPKGYQRLRGQSQTGDVPSSYRCNKCKKSGHWIKNCPYSGKDQVDVKRTTGIPKSFIEKDEAAHVAEPIIADSVVEKNDTIPEDLICSICKDIFTDAVMIPCCGSSFCDDCVRTSLLESEDNECPDCKEKGTSPGSLIPNRFLRNSVNTYKNETGYKRTEMRTVAKPPASPATDPLPSAADEPPAKSETIETERQEQAAKTIENEPEESKDKETTTTEPTETQTAASADMESDYEDNIVVKVPASRENPSQTYKIKSHEANHSRKLMPPGVEHSMNTVTPSRSYPTLSPKSDEIRSGRDNDVMHSGQNKHITSHVYNSSMPIHSVLPRDVMPVSVGSGNRHEIYTRQPYHQMLYQGQVVRGPPMGYNRIPQPHCNSYYQQPPYNTHPGYILPENTDARPIMPPINLASVYQGVAAKVGSGVIDDPLEAFNRIMREKEREREHNRSPNRKRASSADKKNRNRLSPQLLRRSRLHTSPYDHKEDRMIGAKQRDRHGYSREREKSERTRWREMRKSRRSSRSRSRSIPTSRRNVQSNMSRRRYSRSKSPLIIDKRAHYSCNPRNVRRNPEMRSKSPAPNFTHIRNPERSFCYSRQKASPDYEDDKYRDNNYREHMTEIHKANDRHKIEDMQKEIFDVSPPGTSEPPPPGFDGSTTDLGDFREGRAGGEQSSMVDIYEKYESRDFIERKMYEHTLPSERSSRSRSSKRSPEGQIRQSRSRTGSNERFEKTDLSSPKISSDIEIHKRDHREYERHVAKRRRTSDDDEAKRQIISARNLTIVSKNSKTEDFYDSCKNPTELNDFDLGSRKEQKRSEKKEEKLDKKVKDRKKKKKYKEEKERKKQKKRDKQTGRESAVADIFKEAEKDDLETASKKEFSVEDPSDFKCIEGKIQNFGGSMHEEVKELHRESENEVTIEKNIHGLDIDFDDFQHHDVIKGTTLPFPAPSKWEREDQSISSIYFKEENDAPFTSKTPEYKSDKVTEEVLRRAENAIFSRDIKSRHVIDITKSDRDKFSSLDKNSKDNPELVKITIPTTSRAPRSIEIMENKQTNFPLNPVAKRSVRDRLGSKIVKTEETHSQESKQSLHRTHSRDRQKERLREHSRGRTRDRLRGLSKDNSIECHNNHLTGRSDDHSRGRSKDYSGRRSKDRSKVRSKDNVRGRSIENSSGRSKDNPRGRSKDQGDSRGRSKDHPRARSKDPPRGSPKDQSRVRSKDPQRGPSKDPPRGHSKDRSRGACKDHSSERSGDHLRNQSKDCHRSSNSEHLHSRHESEKPRKGEKRIEKNPFASGEKSVSSWTSYSELESDDIKQSKKRKHKKEKKRKKRSSSGEVADSSKKKHKSKKKYKTSKKNKSKT